MPSPFPGVDPFLESQHFWPDFHSRFVNYWCEHLGESLPEEYEARINERVQMIGIEARQGALERASMSKAHTPTRRALPNDRGTNGGQQRLVPRPSGSAGARINVKGTQANETSAP